MPMPLLPLLLLAAGGAAAFALSSDHGEYKHLPPELAQGIKNNLAANNNPAQLRQLAATLRFAAQDAARRGDQAAANDYARAAADLERKANSLPGGGSAVPGVPPAFDPIAAAQAVLNQAGPAAAQAAQAQIAAAAAQAAAHGVPPPPPPAPPPPIVAIPPLPPLPPVPPIIAPPTTTLPIPGGFPVPPTIKQGSTGPVVMQWQNILGVKADGIFGPITATATKNYQAAHNLVPDGIVGPKTWTMALSGGSAAMPPLPVPGNVFTPVSLPIPGPVATGGTHYHIAPGDMPYKIAARFGVTLGQLAGANGAKSKDIVAGKIIAGDTIALPAGAVDKGSIQGATGQVVA